MQRYTSKRVVVHEHQSMTKVLAYGFINGKEVAIRINRFNGFHATTQKINR